MDSRASPGPSHSVTSLPAAAPGTGSRSTVIMSIDTRPTVRVRTPSTSTGVPVAQCARVAVGVAAGRDADAHRRVGREAAAVADASPGCSDCVAISRERSVIAGRGCPVRDVVQRVVGRTAIDHDAGAHPIGRDGGGMGMAQRGGTVAQRPFTRQVAAGGCEHCHLVGDAAIAKNT